jgi:predicted nucleic acid-binding protein
MPGLDEVRNVIMELGLERLRASDNALLRASVAFRKYRKNDGNKTNVLPDFLIGGDASAHAAPLITANAKDFVGYFPEITVVHP